MGDRHKAVKGKKVKKYIELLGQGKFTISMVAEIFGTDYYVAKAMITYLRDGHKILDRETINGKVYYSVKEERADG